MNAQFEQQLQDRTPAPRPEQFRRWSFETSVEHVRILTRGPQLDSLSSAGVPFWRTRCCRIIALILFAFGVALVCWAIYEITDEESNTEVWQWQQWCNHKLQLLEQHGCIVNVRNDLPVVRNDAEYDVFHAINFLSVSGTLISMFNHGHSCLMLQEKGKDLGEGLSMVLEYAAVDFGPEAIAPTIFTNGSFKWKDDAVVAWFPWANRPRWINGSNVTRVGSVNSATLAKWFGDIASYVSQNRGYALWSVMSGEDVTKARIYKNSNMSHDFPEWGLLQLHTHGAKFDLQEPLCRIYFALQTKARPKLAHIEFRVDMINFYQNLKDVMHAKVRNFSEFGDILRSHFEAHGHNAYVHERGILGGRLNHRYYRVALAPPFLLPGLYQRMALPWQHSKVVVGECSIARESGMSSRHVRLV